MKDSDPRPAAPHLLADIGATSARLCIESQPGRFEQVAVERCDDHPDFTSLVGAYLARLPGPRPRHGAVALANPIEGDWVRMTNRPWAFSIREAQKALQLRTLLLVNDFSALAFALPYLGGPDRLQVGGGKPEPGGVLGLIGPGTGLGISGLIPHGGRRVTLASEGGHGNFAPGDERDLRVLRHALSRLDHVSNERLLSAAGLELIHGALADGAAVHEQPLSVGEIVRRAREGACPACAETLQCFSAMLGSAAGDLALTLGATGGIYVAGGIVPRLGPLFDRAAFRARFEAKGRFTSYVARIPTYIVLAEHPALNGLSALLAEHLPERDGGPNPLLDRIRGNRHALSPAEQRVADYVLENPRAVLGDAIAVIAEMAEVSQPTVIRFCRTLGFQGLADFKLKLASGLTSARPMQRTPVRPQDATADLCAKVLENTASAILQFRDGLNADTVDQAIKLVHAARRVELFAMGNSTVVALDGQHKMFRFRIPAVAHTDASLHALAADLLGPGDVAVFISSSGQPADLVRAAGLAAARGAAVIAITASNSPLARRAQVCIAVDHDEDSLTFVAMISRILHLLALDMVGVGVAVRRSPEAAPAEGAEGSPPAGQAMLAPGMLVSHVT